MHLRTIEACGNPLSNLPCLTGAISSMTIFRVAVRGIHTAICYYSVSYLSVGFSNRSNLAPDILHREIPCSKRYTYIFDARLHMCKTDTRIIV
jgi:hypothetical protein